MKKLWLVALLLVGFTAGLRWDGHHGRRSPEERAKIRSLIEKQQTK